MGVLTWIMGLLFIIVFLYLLLLARAEASRLPVGKKQKVKVVRLRR